MNHTIPPLTCLQFDSPVFIPQGYNFYSNMLPALVSITGMWLTKYRITSPPAHSVLCPVLSGVTAIPKKLKTNPCLSVLLITPLPGHQPSSCFPHSWALLVRRYKGYIAPSPLGSGKIALTLFPRFTSSSPITWPLYINYQLISKEASADPPALPCDDLPS